MGACVSIRYRWCSASRPYAGGRSGAPVFERRGRGLLALPPWLPPGGDDWRLVRRGLGSGGGPRGATHAALGRNLRKLVYISSCRGVRCCKLKGGHVTVPVPVIPPDILRDHCFYCLIRSLHRVTVGCVRRSLLGLYSERLKGFRHGDRRKLSPVIGNNGVWTPVAVYYALVQLF